MIKKTINALRKDYGLSKKDLAEELGVPYTTYLSYENGTQSMPAYVFSGICDIFNISRDNVIIPNCIQKYTPSSTNTGFEKTYLYRKGYADGQKDIKKKLKKIICL